MPAWLWALPAVVAIGVAGLSVARWRSRRRAGHVSPGKPDEEQEDLRATRTPPPPEPAGPPELAGPPESPKLAGLTGSSKLVGLAEPAEAAGPAEPAEPAEPEAQEAPGTSQAPAPGSPAGAPAQPDDTPGRRRPTYLDEADESWPEYERVRPPQPDWASPGQGITREPGSLPVSPPPGTGPGAPGGGPGSGYGSGRGAGTGSSGTRPSGGTSGWRPAGDGMAGGRPSGGGTSGTRPSGGGASGGEPDDADLAPVPPGEAPGALRDAGPATQPPQPAPTGSRYANVTLAGMPRHEPWPAGRPLEPDRLLLLRIGIGPLAAASHVQPPVPFPDEHLPGGDLTIDVVITSETIWVGPGIRAVRTDWGHSQQDSFLLPADGGPARTADGSSELLFELLTPHEPGTARLRIGYYCRGAVVQSQVLVADIAEPGTPGGPWSLRTDYTIAEDLPSAAAIPDRPRVAVVLHEDAAGQMIFARGAGVASGTPVRGTPEGGGPGTAITVPPALADRVRALRKLLASEPVAPVTVRQSKTQLVAALRALAPAGWELYAGLFPSMRETFYQLGAGSTGTGSTRAGPAVLHVARPAGVGLSVPWAYLYSAGIDSAYAARGFAEVPLCPLVEDWDGRSALVTEDLADCPHAAAVSHASNLLCPFGFLGMRHDIEQLSSSQRPVLSIEARSGARVVIAETAYQVSPAALGAHVTALRETVGARLPGVSCLEATSKAELAELIRADLPLVYFYCHGERPVAGSPETYLGIGRREWVTAPDFMSWVQEAYLGSGLRVWDRVRPLVFINACHSAELDPRALFNYVDAFVGVGNAAGVIGTEVRVHQDLAMRFAQAFFGELLADGGTVAGALRRARLRFLAGGNLFGLNYTPYCWADLSLGGPS
ncbi:MAG TPA: CHAT domain-containing protein [Streptosporangiaceae bacterium]|nr:CHAT domain-containing protein [Streptosporangiaceae bacterium]